MGRPSASRFNHQAYHIRATGTTALFTAPTAEYDTIRCHADSLPFNYMGLRTQQIKAFGDYTVYYSRTGECDRDIRLTVEQIVDPQTIVVDTTLCQGRRIRVNGKNYTTDTCFTVREVQAGEQVTKVYNIHFTQPELEYDTINCHADSLPFNYGKYQYDSAYSDVQIKAMGKRTITLRDPTYQLCTRKVSLYVRPIYYRDTMYSDTTLCLGRPFEMEGATRVTGDTLYRTRSTDNVTYTYHYTYHRVHYVEQDMLTDTISAFYSELPYLYQTVAGRDTLSAFGDYQLLATPEADCRQRYEVHLVQRWASDTTVVRDTVCADPTVVMPSFDPAVEYLPTDSTMADTIHVIFYLSEPEMIVNLYDTIVVELKDFPTTYMDETIPAEGDYEIAHPDYHCRTTYLHVVAPAALPSLTGTEQSVTRKFVYEGRLYILYDGRLYDSTGRQIPAPASIN